MFLSGKRAEVEQPTDDNQSASRNLESLDNHTNDEQTTTRTAEVSTEPGQSESNRQANDTSQVANKLL